MSDVVLINSPIVLNRRNKSYFISEGDEKSNYPMGLLYIGACLEQNSFSVKVLDVTAAGLTLEDILDVVGREKPVFVGISSLTPGMRSAVLIAEELKNKFKQSITIGLGGAHVNCDDKFIERFPVFDLSVIGEGEQAVVDIVKSLKKGKKVTGIIYGKLIDDLDQIPPAARHLVDIRDYFRDEDRSLRKKPVATLLTSRGCPYRCCFCSIPIFQRKVRFRSAKKIVDEMESLYEDCDGKYTFADDSLTLNKENTINLCKEIIRRNLKVRWSAMTRVNLLDEELVNLLSQAGGCDFFLGVESGSERIRNEVIKKQISDKQITETIKLCHKYDIHTNIFLMVGFPGETRDDLEKTINIGNKIKPGLMGIRITIPFPGTEIFKYAQKEGMISSSIIDDYASGKLTQEKKSFHDIWPVFVPKNLTLQELIKAKKRAYLKFYLNPSWVMRRLVLWIKDRQRFKEDLVLFKVAPYAFLKGKTKSAMS